MRIDVVTEEIQFSALKEEWNALLGESENNEITLTWEWLHTWWDAFKNASRKLLILTVRESDGKLIGIAPLQRQILQSYRLLPQIRQLAFLASGETPYDSTSSDYLNFILLRGREREVLSAMVRYLVSDLAAEWDEIWLANMMADSVASRELEELIPDLRYQKFSGGSCFHIRLPNNWDAFMEMSGSDLRAAIRRNRKSLAQEGRVDFLTAEDGRTAGQYLEILTTLHGKRCAEKEVVNIFSDSSYLSFYKVLSFVAFGNHWLKLSVLFFNQSPIAAFCNFQYNNKIYFHASGTITHLQKNFAKTISPGFLLHSYCIEGALAAGVKEYDFMKGNSEYERKWERKSRPLTSFRIVPRGTRAWKTILSSRLRIE